METNRVSAIAEAWSGLSSRGLPIGGLHSRLAVPNGNSRFYVALDSNGARHFLIKLEANEQGLEDANTKGVQVYTREMNDPHFALARYIDIQCRDRTGFDAFDLVGADLSVLLGERNSDPSTEVKRVLGKWRRFWGIAQKEVLSPERQLGLLAEVRFLSSWLAQIKGIDEALGSWQGPQGARHDFQWIGHSVEVKATSRNDAVHKVNGVDQLAEPEDGRLWLYSLVATSERTGATSLQSVIDVCLGLLERSPTALTLFEQKLALSGYFSVYEDEYREARWRIIEEKVYAVVDDFPRLTRERMLDGIPSGITRIDYEISLAGFENLCVAKTPGELRSTLASRS